MVSLSNGTYHQPLSTNHCCPFVAFVNFVVKHFWKTDTVELSGKGDHQSSLGIVCPLFFSVEISNVPFSVRLFRKYAGWHRFLNRWDAVPGGHEKNQPSSFTSCIIAAQVREPGPPSENLPLFSSKVHLISSICTFYSTGY